MALESQPWPGFLWQPATGTWGPALRGIYCCPAASAWGPALRGIFFFFFFFCPTASTWGPALRELLLLLGSWCVRVSPERAPFIVHQQVLVCGEREATLVPPLSACDSAVVPASMAVWSSSVGIPCCRFPPSRPLSPSPTASCSSHPRPVLQISHSSPQPPCKLVNTHPSPGCRSMVQTVYVVLTLSRLTHISHFTLLWQPQMLPFFPNWFPHWREGFPGFRNLSSASAPLPRGAGPILLPLLLLLSSFFILPSYRGIFIVLPVPKVFC